MRSRPCCSCRSAPSRWSSSAAAWVDSPAAMESLLAVPATLAAADPRAHLAALLLQLHLHSAVHHRVSAHRDLLPDRAADGAVQAHGHLLSAVHPGDLAALRVPRRGGERDDRDVPRIAAEAGRAADAGAAPASISPERARGTAPRGGRRRRSAGDARLVRAGVARRESWAPASWRP